MHDTIQPHKALTAEEQVALFHSRESVRGRRDVAKELFRTHNFGVVDAAIVAGVFPAAARQRPITFSTKIGITGASAAGIVFEFGGTANGLKLGISGGKFELAAGEGTTGNDGVDDSVTDASLGTIGYTADVVLAINPGNGKARLFVNGELVGRANAPSATRMLNGEWANAVAGGAVGAAQNVASTQRTAVTINGAPVDFVLLAPVLAFVGQIPRQFD